MTRKTAAPRSSRTPRALARAPTSRSARPDPAAKTLEPVELDAHRDVPGDRATDRTVLLRVADERLQLLDRRRRGDPDRDRRGGKPMVAFAVAPDELGDDSGAQPVDRELTSPREGG